MLNFTVIWSVLKRNVQSYFSGVLGYLVIVLFVTIAAFCAFSPEFFANNLANLDQLSEIFPILLLPMVPAITMGIWAEEKKLGTDEILFTLPASDVEILLGKYLSALTVYTIALAFSLTQLFVLAWIGNPDWGVVFTTYVGYWLAGAALLSAGMFASALTGSTTVAYVLGVALCSIPVFIGAVAPGNTFIQGLSLSSQLREFSSGLIPITGVLYFVTLTLFMLYLNMVLITRRHWAQSEKVAMGAQYALRAAFLAAALISANFMAEKSTAYFVSRVDMTAQNLYTLSPTTKEVIKTAREKKRPVTIQAFISPEVPQSYVYARKQLVGLLRQYERIGGNMVDLRLVDVQPNSKEAREARTLGIEPVRDRSEVGGKEVEQDVHLGVVITSNVGEVVIPFLDGETSMEYELTRSMATVTSRPERLKVGVLETDGLRLSTDTPVRSFFQNTIENLEQQYNLVEVTREQLADFVEAAEKDESKEEEEDDESDSDEDTQVDADETAEEDEEEEDIAEDKPDVLIVVQPSSLTQSAMDTLVKYIELGNPTLLLADPLPFFPYVYYRPEDLGITNAPRQERPSPDSGLAWISSFDPLPIPPQAQQQLMQMQQQLSRMPPQFARQMLENFYEQNPQARRRFPPKADGGTASTLLEAIGLEWNSGRVVWDIFNPHPDFTPTWPREVFGENWPKSYGPQENALLFVTPNNGADAAFNPENPISAGLQELLFTYPGTVRKADDSDLNFQPLVTTGPESGSIPWDDLTYTEMTTVENFDHATQERKVSREPRKSRLTDKPLVRLHPRPKKSFNQNTHTIAAHVTSDEEADDDGERGINVVFVADIDFMNDFYFEQEENLDKPADNIPFLFNAIEVLAGDDSMVTLRNRRAKPRRLTAIQGEIEKFRRQRSKEQQKAEAKIRKKLEDAREEVEKKQEEIAQDTELGFVQKFGQLGEAVDVAQQDFEIQRERLEEQLQQTIADLKGTEQQQIDRLETRVRYAAVLLPPIPALLLGLSVLIVRVINEEKRVVDSRRHA